MNPVDPKPYLDTISVISSPLSIVALALILCTCALATASVFASKYDPSAFKWVIHAFLGIFGAFVLVLVYCPSIMLNGNVTSSTSKDSPTVVVIAMFGGIFSYMAYQIWRKKVIKQKEVDTSNQENKEEM